jgi:hypothetical protein
MIYPPTEECKYFFPFSDNQFVETNKKNSSKPTGRSPRFLLLMPEDLRREIERSAFANGRTLTAEINKRLRESLNAAKAPDPASAQPVGKPLPPSYLAAHHVTSAQTNIQANGVQLSTADHAMLGVFRSLPAEKQLALLSLFK